MEINELYHFGVKGQKWGIRKEDSDSVKKEKIRSQTNVEQARYDAQKVKYAGEAEIHKALAAERSSKASDKAELEAKRKKYATVGAVAIASLIVLNKVSKLSPKKGLINVDNSVKSTVKNIDNRSIQQHLLPNMIHSDDDFLEHFGIKGQKWGIRKEDDVAVQKAKINATKEIAMSENDVRAAKDAGRAEVQKALIEARNKKSIATEESRGKTERTKMIGAVAIIGLLAAKRVLTKGIKNGAFKHSDDIDFLEHFGIKGMKWGERRYQNEDGTLTAEGKIRYSNQFEPTNAQEIQIKNNALNSLNTFRKSRSVAVNALPKEKREELEKNFAEEDKTYYEDQLRIEREKIKKENAARYEEKQSNETSALLRDTQSLANQAAGFFQTGNGMHVHPNYDNISSKEMQDYVNRKSLELSYAKAKGEDKYIKSGSEKTREILQTIGTAAGIALTIAEIRKHIKERKSK